MLTQKGKNVLAKYLVNQAPGYAGYIAVGCGSNPLSTMTFDVSLANVTTGTATITTSSAHNFLAGDVVFITGIDGAYDGKFTIASVPNTTTFTITGSAATANVDPVINGKVTHNFVQKEYLDFEMFRVPIVSRGIVVENSLTKVLFTAELPNLEQYGMTEIGIYPSGSNPTASTIDSRTLFNFSDTENWEYHSDVVEKPVSYVGGAGYANSVINMSTSDNFVLINSYDPIFTNYDRMTSKEQPRFESKTLMLRGNTSAINTSPTTYSIYENSSFPENQSHIHHTNLSFSFDKNSADDVLKLAFSVITEATTTSINTANVTQYSEIGGLNIIVQFTDSETLGSSEYANMQFSLNSTDLKANNANTQYYVVQKSFSELKYSANFQWSSVNTVKIFASAFANVGTNVSASSITSNVATVTTSTAHGLIAGDAFVITDRAGYNGLYQVATNVNATAFTYSITASDIGSNLTDGGIVTKLLGNHFIALDGLRFENISSAIANPLYGLTGYSLLAETALSSNGASITNYPVIKQRNTNNFIEFKFAVDTGGVI
jgi:hypothetical protein